MRARKRVIITGVHQDDAHYIDRDAYIGKTGTFKLRPPHPCRGYYSGEFRPDNEKPNPSVFFLGVRYKKL